MKEKEVDQTSRPEGSSFEGSSIGDALNAKESKLEKLPFNCLQHILSFMTFKKVAEMKQVSKLFNETVIKHYGEAQKKLERRLKREIERVGKRVLFLTNTHSSFNMQRFLNHLHEVINDCLLTYSLIDVDDFVPAKFLDEANCLLKDFNSLTIVPYFHEHVCDRKLYSLLGLITAHSRRACDYFIMKIINRNLEEVIYKRFEKQHLEVDLLVERNKMRKKKANLLKIQRQQIGCGKRMSREFFQLLSKLNGKVLNLIQLAINVDEEVERAINCMDGPIVKSNKGQSNCLFPLSTLSCLPSLGETRAMKISGSKRPFNLATLPSLCIENIVSNLNCNKMAQLRIVCKSFNESCKKKLNQEFEDLHQKLEFEIHFKEQHLKCYAMKMFDLKIDLMKDLCSFLKLCQDNYKWHLGTNYYFSAGIVLDEAKFIYYNDITSYPFVDDLNDFDRSYKYRPHYVLFRLMDLVYKAVAHFKFTIVPKYFLSAQKANYVSDFLITSDNACNFNEENQLNLEEIEILIKEADMKIKRQNYNNRKFLKTISGLKKKIVVLNKEISEKILWIERLK